MFSRPRRSFLLPLLAAASLFISNASYALQFEPGVGVGLEYSDNVRLTPDAIPAVDDLISVGYVGARIFEDTGSLKYDASTSFNNHSYTQDTFPDQHYFNLAASAGWAMIKDRFDWSLSDVFNQRTVNVLNSNTPDNLQDTNVFTLGANIRQPVSARQNFSLRPTFSQYYYEALPTDNDQYALSANWNYQMFRLTNVGLSLSAKKINYTETDSSGQSIEDTVFTTIGFTFSGQRLRSSFSGNLGATSVKRDNGDRTSGFSGSLDWSTDLTSRSKLETQASTDLTDTSSVGSSVIDDPVSGGEVQITTDVIRNSLINLDYLREDAALSTRISATYRKLTYSENPLDRVIRSLSARLNYPVTPLLLSGAYITVNRTEQLDTDRLDKYFTLGGNLNYRFSRKWHSLFDIKYRVQESTSISQEYDEVSVFASLVYGFGDVYRPSRAGGY